MKDSIILLSLFAASITSLFGESNKNFPLNSPQIESMKFTTELTKNLDDIELVDSLSIIEKVDLQYLKSMIDPEKPTILYFWSLLRSEELQFNKWKELVNNNNYDTFIISLDISSSVQIEIMRKLFIKNDFTTKTYILYGKYDSPNSVIEEIKNLDNAFVFINSIDKKSEEFELPYAIILKDNKIVQRVQNVNDFDFDNANLNTNNDQVIAFSNMKIIKDEIKESKNELAFPSQITAEYIGVDTEVPNTYKLKEISANNISEILDDNCKKLIHVWGTWCSTPSLGIIDFKKLIPDENDNYKAYLIAADMQTEGQVKLIESFLYDENISTNSYIIQNKFESIKDLDKYSKFEHTIDLISKFDPDYKEVSLPYTVVLDEKNNIIYKRALEIDKKYLQPGNENYLDELYHKFKNMEIKKILKLLRN